MKSEVITLKVRKSMEKFVQSSDHHKYKNISALEYADPLFGVGSATSAGPTLPGGSIHPSPETLEKDCGGYTRNQPIVGFGQLYTSGAGGVKCYGNFLFAPMSGNFSFEDNERAQYVVEGTEIARSYEYMAELKNGLKIKVTPSHHSAIYEVEFPKGKEASFILDVGRKLDIEDCMDNGCVTVNPSEKSISGGGHMTGNWSDNEWDMYFHLEFDRDFEEMGILTGEEITLCKEETTSSINEKKKLLSYVKFGIPDEPLKVRVKIAISFISTSKAKEHLTYDIPDFDYDSVKENAKDKWSEMFGAIDIKTDDKSLLRRFYTAMYHMNVQPRDRREDHGNWDDFHTVWDTWKTVFPMYSLLYPEKMASIIESFCDRANKNRIENPGVVVGDEYTGAVENIAGQGGNDIENAIADAYIKGIRLNKYEWEELYKIMLESAENMRSPDYIEKGYSTKNAYTVSGRPYTFRFKPASSTLGFAFNDKAVSYVAKELGTKEEYEKYSSRSLNWRNVWNENIVSEGFIGFPQNRNNDGTFDADFDAHKGYNSHFYEATSWDASYINYNDVSNLVETMGGKEKFIYRLLWACEHSKDYYNDDHGKEGYLNFTNEPSFHIPWLFCTDEIKRPDLASQVIDRVIERFTLENDYPGDEDNGGMSSYYVFLMCGFFPYSTTENYYLHGTRVEEITFRLGNGNVFKVTGENTGGKNIYVQSATWKGEPLTRCKLTHSEIISGGELHFVMGDKPSRWAIE
ncbi:MAG: glycoside hydrolase family 92 protein [Ruminococcaceae bacterium]|nr:glycoside hydrolase family 92 protein [Oscillospiraceae bacterium]